MNKKITITIAIIGILGSAILVGITTALYIKQNSNRQEIERLKAENTEIKKNLRKSENKSLKKSKKSKKTTPKSTKNRSPKNSSESKSPSDNEKKAIKKLIIAAGETELSNNSTVLDVKDVRYKNNWATAWVVPKDNSMEGYLSVLQKKDGSWAIIDSGTGLTHSDYPSSPKEIWPY